MNIRESTRESLSFDDGDEVLLTHLNGEHRVWANGVEAFSRAHFHDDHIEFRHLNDDGEDIESISNVENTYRSAYFRAFGDVAYKGWMLREGDDEWQRNTVAAPYPVTVDGFRQKHLVPLGANSFPLTVMDGDGLDGEFSLQTIMQALVDKTIPIGSNPGYFHHDMDDHSIALSAIDRQSMAALRSFALFSQQLAKRYPFEAHDLAASVAGWLDYYSYFSYFAESMATSNIDLLLSNVLNSTFDISEKHRKHLQTICKNNGFEVAGYIVTRPPEIQKYYADALEILDPKPKS